MKFQSRYSHDKLVTAAQYITELICEKKAKCDLPQQFWKHPKWEKFYRQQIVAANGLLKKYQAKAIILALKSDKTYSVYSLRHPNLPHIILTEQERLEQQELTQKVEVTRQDVMVRPPEKNVRNSLSRLKELDG